MADKTVGHRDPITECADPMDCVLVPLEEVHLRTLTQGLPIELES